MAGTISAGARAQVTVELSGLGSWGTDCTVAQVHKQAAEAAISRLQQMFHENKQRHSVMIVGVKVTGVFTEDEERS